MRLATQLFLPLWWDSPETADVEAEAVSGNEDEVPIASEELTDGMDISDEPEQDAAETPAAENPDAEPTERRQRILRARRRFRQQMRMVRQA